MSEAFFEVDPINSFAIIVILICLPKRNETCIRK